MSNERHTTTSVNIRLESGKGLDAYASVPASFQVCSVLEVVRKGNLFTLTERQVDRPYTKDYDSIAANSPRDWSRRFVIDQWGLFSARLNDESVGAAAVACDPTLAPGTDSRDAVLWDLRVAPEHRGRGVASALFAAVEAWSRSRQRSAVVAETQNINAPACRFYASRGAVLQRVEAGAYRDFPDEVQLVWRKKITVDPAP